MFNCYFCKGKVGPGVPCKKVITATYIWQHSHRRKVQKHWVKDRGKIKLEWIDDQGAVGSQIAQEVMSCTACASKFEKEGNKKIIDTRIDK